jgi:hypothetical protein
MDRMVIKLLWLHQIHFGWIVDRTTISSILDELWTEQPSVSFWMNYRQNGYQLNLQDCTSSILDERWTEWPSVPFWMNYGQNGHQFHFGWIMDRMTTPVPFWINWCSSHGGSFTLVTLFSFFSSNSWSFNPGLKIESGVTYHTTRASALTHVYWTININFNPKVKFSQRFFDFDFDFWELLWWKNSTFSMII